MTRVIVIDHDKTDCNSQNYEIADIIGVSGSDLTFNYHFLNIAQGSKTNCQIIHILEFNTVSISAPVTCDGWSNANLHGGVMIFKSNASVDIFNNFTTTFGALTMAGKGLPGGNGGNGGNGGAALTTLHSVEGAAGISTHLDGYSATENGNPTGDPLNPAWNIAHNGGIGTCALYQGGDGGTGMYGRNGSIGLSGNVGSSLGNCNCDISKKYINLGKGGRGGSCNLVLAQAGLAVVVGLRCRLNLD